MRQFRNFQSLEVSFPLGAQFISGFNGQGKSNLLEAFGLVTTLRSFRATETPTLINWHAHPREALLVYEISHDRFGDTTIELNLRPGSKRVRIDGEPVHKLGDIIGDFPTITFSSQDIQILRGGPALRRRLMDLMFVVMDPAYFEILARYYQALKSRNALLKQRAPGPQRKVFEDALIREGYELTRIRESLLNVYRPHFRIAYAGISGVDEDPLLDFHPSIESTDPASYESAFLGALRRDEESGTTNKGPHRDDLSVKLLGHSARDFASEGQQRGIVLALRMGLAHWFKQRGGTSPVILADDIVGELDPVRRQGFWKMLGDECQVIATGTTYPREDTYHNWKHWFMNDGQISLKSAEETG